MASNCPPQLQLSLQPNTTSFKRSFEQFGFDLASPVEGSGGSSNDGNDRNKRARSESSFSDSTDSTDSSQASMLPSGSSGSRSPQREEDDMGFTRTSQPSLGPPRLPTLDIEMPDYPTEELHSPIYSEDVYRLSSESFNSLGSSNVVRRQPQPASPGLTRVPSPPPVLPPLAISDDQSISTSPIPFLHTPPQASTPLDVLFGGGQVSSPSTSHTSAEDSEMIQGFRARLASALERLTPQSPLVPGLDLDEQEEQLQSRIDNNDDSGLQELTVTEVPAEPPTLPPILSVSTGPEIDHFNIEDLLAEERSLHSLSSTSVESPSSSSISPTLDSHPLPSPILRDLHSWMDERTNPTRDDSTSPPSSLLWQSRFSRVANPIVSASNVVPSSSGPGGGALREVLDGRMSVPFPGNVYHDTELPGSRVDDGSVSENDQPISRPLQDMGLWESRNRPPTPPPRPSSPDPSTGRPGGRMRSSSRLRSRPASSISLVTENSLEARRRADHDHVMRDLYAGLRQTNEGMDVEMLNGSHLESTRQNVRSRHQSFGQDPERPHVPYVLNLPPLPTPRLDVAPDTREDQESHLPTPASLGLLYSSFYRPGGRGRHEAVRPRELAGNSLTQGFIPSNPEPSSAFSSPHYQGRPAGRLSPLRMDPLPSASNLEWRQAGPHSAPSHVHDESHGVQWARPFIPDHESPPLLPSPDFGHSFETDRDVEMRIMAAQTQEQSRRTHEPHHPPPPFPFLPQRSHVSSEDLRTRGWPSVASHSSDRPPRLRPHQLQSVIRDLSSLPEIRPPPPRQYIPQEASPEERRHPWEFLSGRQQVAGDTRRAPRFFPPPRTEDRSSTSAGRSFVNPLSSSLRGRANLNIAEDRSRYREPSPLPNTYRNESPTIRFHSTFVGDVERQQEPVTSTSLDPSEFAPGPFRNTINQSFHRRTNRPTPPTIPPLSFEDIGPPPSHYFTEFPSSPQAEEATSQGSPNEANFASNRRTNPSSEQRAFGSSSHSRHSTLSSNIDAGNSVPVQQRLALYRHLSQRVRMEPSRLDSPFSEGPLVSSADSIQRHTLPPPPIDPIRHDGDNMTRHLQLLEYHHQEVERRRRNMARNEAALDDNNAERPPHSGGGPPPARRFGGVDLENLQHSLRSRRRLRLPPNLLSNPRMMGNSGDFMHDDDFDDSYENLINLASSLGEVKSKSTPREVIEKLAKGKYKDWKSDDGDKRCPICLDDYSDHDTLLKLSNCSHWFHQGCLQQWLHSANTCPVCRNPVQNSSPTASSPRRSRRFVFWRAGGPAPPSPGNGGSSTRPPGSGNPAAYDRFSNAFPGYHR